MPAVRRRALLSLLVVAAAGVLVSAATAANGGLTPANPESPNAESIRTTFWVLVAATGVVFVGVETLLVLFIVRYRSRNRDRNREGPQIHGASRLELAWTAIPVVVLATIMAVVFVELPTVDHIPPANASSQLTIRVEGHQYYWQFRYPGGQTSIDRLVVPVNEVVTLDVVSADVIHSWWVPELGGKIDAFPGTAAPNRTWFQAQREGTYTVRCAEFCGLEHAHMTGTVEVVDRTRYAHFLASHVPRKESSQSGDFGLEAFVGVCAKCHGAAGEGDYGPSLRTSAVVKDQRALAALLRAGKGNMPAVGKTWSDDELQAVGTYLRSRFEGGTSAGD
jgi:cytochrome c oxidase subunit 2